MAAAQPELRGTLLRARGKLSSNMYAKEKEMLRVEEERERQLRAVRAALEEQVANAENQRGGQEGGTNNREGVVNREGEGEGRRAEGAAREAGQEGNMEREHGGHEHQE
eukprot:1159054-Pelagomonas_calceolata.AAC.21